MQITTRGYEKVHFSGFENFNKRSGGLGDTLIYVTAKPRLAKRLFIKTAKVSELTDKETSIFFEPVCQTAKIFNGKYINNSMTSLFAHKVAQPTKWRFLPKNLNQLVIFVIGLAFT